MPKKKAESKHVRLIRRGDVVKSRQSKTEEVVRGVEIVLHLSNGVSEVYDSDEALSVIPPEDLPDLEGVEQ